MAVDRQVAGNAVRFAVSGIHGSGKTTLCHSVVARLRRKGVNAAIASESARQSLFLASRTISPEMEIEILGLQLIEEMRASLTADIVLCDRCVLDTFAYCLARFPGTGRSDQTVLLDAIGEFGRTYARSYRKIFYLPNEALFGPTGDAFRDTDPVKADAVALAFERVIAAWQSDVVRLDRNTALETISDFIQAQMQASTRLKIEGGIHGNRSA